MYLSKIYIFIYLYIDVVFGKFVYKSDWVDIFIVLVYCVGFIVI